MWEEKEQCLLFCARSPHGWLASQALGNKPVSEQQPLLHGWPSHGRQAGQAMGSKPVTSSLLPWLAFPWQAGRPSHGEQWRLKKHFPLRLILIFNYMYVWICGECRCPQSPEEGVMASGTEVTGNGCDYSSLSTGNELGPSVRAAVRLTADHLSSPRIVLLATIFRSHMYIAESVH